MRGGLALVIGAWALATCAWGVSAERDPKAPASSAPLLPRSPALLLSCSPSPLPRCSPALLLLCSFAQAADTDPDARPPAPWHLAKITKLNHARPEADADKRPGDERPRFLHLQLQFRPDLADRRHHVFRVTDARGETVAELFGFHKDRSLLVFEGDWRSLAGLYLDGLGHREPLFARAASSATGERPKVPSKPVAVESSSPWEIDPPLDDRPGADAAARPAPTVEVLQGAKGPPALPKSGVRIGLGADAALGAGSDARGAGGAAPGGSGLAAGGGAGSGLGAGGAGMAGPGAGGAGMAGSGGGAGPARRGGGGGGRTAVRLPLDSTVEPPSKPPPRFVLYLSCRDPSGRGRVYQVDEQGDILGLVTLPYAATGLALHCERGLVAAVPRRYGQILQIDHEGKVSVLLERDPLLTHPVDVGIAGRSDEILVADSIGQLLASTSMAGHKARLYRRLAFPSRDSPAMSVAVTLDKQVLYGTDREPGIYRFSGDDSPVPAPILPKSGGVAADPDSLQWAATQPGQVIVYDGPLPLRTYRLPPEWEIYRQGLVSFAPGADVVAAARAADAAGAEANVRFLLCPAKGDSVRSLFVWKKEPVEDFVVGPRMPWEPYTPEKPRRLY